MPLPTNFRQNTFLILGSVILGGTTLGLFYYNYMLLQPHFSSIFWAFVAFSILRKFRNPVASFFQKFNEAIPSKLSLFLKFGICLSFLFLIFQLVRDWNSLHINQRFLYILLYIVVILLILLPFVLSYSTLATIFVLVMLFTGTIFVAVFLGSKCYNESIIARNSIENFIEQNKIFLMESNSTETKMEKILFSGCSVISNALFNEYYTGEFIQRKFNATSGDSFCDNRIHYLRSNLSHFLIELANLLASNIGWFGSGLTNFFKTSLDVINRIGDFLFSFIIFMTFLFYFIQFEDVLSKELKNLSPLGSKETEAVVTSIYENVIKTFSYALLLAIVKFLITLVSFWIADFEVIWVFAFVSGFLTIIPILSSWIIWLPATVLIIARDGISSPSWIIMISLNISGIFIDNAIYKVYFKDQKPELIGMSIIFGMYTWGPQGVLYGPISLTF
eukprot:gene10259-2678_t